MTETVQPERVRLIVADDLTGAADACVKLAGRGRSASVIPDLDRATPPLVDRRDLVAISMDTRRRPHGEARGRVARAAALAGGRASGPVFLKIDSTLRGHLGEEIGSALDVFACTHAIVAPAFPAMGRCVIDGSLVVQDANAPVPVDIRARLAGQGLSGDRVLIADASTQADLEQVVRAGRAGGGRPLWVGSAGLAEAFATSDALPHPADVCVQPHRGRPGPIVVCIGSTHPATRAQQSRLSERPDARVLRVTPAAWRLTTRELDAFTRAGVAGFVLTGGDTATAVCGALEAEAIDLAGEVGTGVPWGVIHGGQADGVLVVLKSGAFGGPGALVDAVDFLSATMATDLH
jgi:D-threonate/D-erythronate kinase